MSEQLPLFPPFQRHSATSMAAAAAIEPKAGTLRAAVLTFVRNRGRLGATDEEIQLALHMNGSTERPRRVELQNAGLVIDSTRIRKTRAGRIAVVWITPHNQEGLTQVNAIG